LANPEHLAKLKEGVESWGQWRKQNSEVLPDLHGANLVGADLSGAILSGAILSEADLSKANLSVADLSRANLFRANLAGADLSGAYLAGANLRKAHLGGAHLSAAHLSNANFNEADLREANLTGANLRGANLVGADLRGAILREADLVRAILVGTNLEGANLTASRVYGISAWDVRLEGAIQSKLVITPREETPIQVDNLEVAQFIYLLLSRQKLRDVITTIGEKAVLILGRFTERKELLDRMADKLRLLGYIPMIFDFDRPTDRDLTETVKILAGLSRFVIADITNPRSVPLELQATVPDYMVPFVTILQRGQPAFGMFDDLPRKYHWALPLLEYNNADTLLAAFEHKVVAPALKKVAQVRKKKAASPRRRSAEGKNRNERDEKTVR
jgi:hypothetical protein